MSIVRALAVAIVLSALALGCGSMSEAPSDGAVPGAGAASTPGAGPAGEPPALRAELIDLVRVSREVVEVRLTLLNDGTQPLELGPRFAQREEDGPSVSGLVIVEQSLQKKSFVLRDARDQPICSTGIGPLAPGERRQVWARFPAPTSPSVVVQLPGLPPFSPVGVPSAETP